MEDDDLAAIQQQLEAREPIFHRPELGTTRADFDRMMAEDFFEIGASGTLYSRDEILSVLAQRHEQPVAESLSPQDFTCHRLAEDLFLLNYVLPQPGRLTRRTTLWRRAAQGWKIVFHQGTIVQQQ